jgi:hypothetical protein
LLSFIRAQDILALTFQFFHNSNQLKCSTPISLQGTCAQPIRSINTFDKRQDANLDHRAAQYRWERGSENVVEQEIVFECWRFRVKVESATRDQNIQPLSFPGLIIPSNALTVKGLHEE